MTDAEFHRVYKTHTARIERLIQLRGLELIHTASGALRIIGRGVDILTTSLRHVTAADLKPARALVPEITFA